MYDQTAVAPSQHAAFSPAESTSPPAMISNRLLSALLVIALPIAFWLAVGTLIFATLGVSISVTGLAIAACLMAAVLIPIWASLTLGRRTRS